MRGEVEHEDGEIVGHIELSQCTVEFDTVDDLGVSVDEHMLCSEVTVALTHAPAGCTVLKRLRMGRGESVREALERLDPSDLVGLLDTGDQLVKIAFKASLDSQYRCTDVVHSWRLGMEAGQGRASVADVGPLKIASRKPAASVAHSP